MSHSKTARERRSPYQIQVLDRALALLEALSQHGPDLNLPQISDLLGLHKSTAHRLIMVLERHRLIERNSTTGKYRLGLKLFELGTAAVSQLDLRERARPFLEQAVAATGETVHLCIYDNGEVVYLDKVEPARSVRLASSVGRRNTAHCTAVGKAIMAFLPQAQMEAGLVNEPQLLDHLAERFAHPFGKSLSQALHPRCIPLAVIERLFFRGNRKRPLVMGRDRCQWQAGGGWDLFVPPRRG